MLSRQSTVYLLLSTVVVVVLLAFIRIPEVGENQSSYTQNAGELTGTSVLGQTFQASRDHLSGVAVMMATYSGRDNTHDVEFSLKESPDSTQPLRVVRVSPKQFGDNQFYTFSFEPITNSKGKLFYIQITSPESVPGNAITVNIDTKDPYPSGVAYVRGSGRQSIDLAFQTMYNVPAGIFAIHYIKNAITTFSAAWQDNRDIYFIWFHSFLPALITVGVGWYIFTTKKRIRVWQLLLAFFIVAFIIRFTYAHSLPFTDDEGNYLYDAWSLLHGKLAGGDGYVKAPLVLLWVALWEALLGHTALAGRVASIIAGSALVYPIFLLTKTLWNTKAALLSSLLWATMGASVVATLYVHTQPLALLLGASGIALLAYTLPLTKGEPEGVYKWHLIAAGVLIGSAVASRKSMLAIGLVVVLLLWAYSSSITRKIRTTLLVGVGFLAVLILLFGFAHAVYGPEGVIETIGINSAEDGAASVEESQVEQIRAYSLKGMTPFFRESLPLIFASLAGIGFSLQAITRKKWALLLWIIPLAIYWWAWSFFSEYEGSAFMKYGISFLWPAMGLMLLLLPSISLTRISDNKILPLPSALIGLLWLGGFVFFYMNWIKFHANYISEFIPPLAVLGGVGVFLFFEHLKGWKHIWVSRIFAAAAIILFVWASTVSSFITYIFEHTGTFDQKAAFEAATWAKENIPLNEPIFTGASLIPYLSGHTTALNISHPRWYAYEFTRKNPKRLETFLPPIADMLNAYRNSKWLLLDKQTGFSYFMEYSEIEAGVEKDWVSVKGISNGSNTLTFYKRK